jgi:hypothetical protein
MAHDSLGTKHAATGVHASFVSSLSTPPEMLSSAHQICSHGRVQAAAFFSRNISTTRHPQRYLMNAASRSAHSIHDDAVRVVQKQLEYYNARDLDQFMSLMAPEVQTIDATTGKVLASGVDELRPRYVERFKTPVHCELLGRLCCGNVVVDREVITGLPDGAVADCLATYTVEDGKITKIQFVWMPRPS